MIDFAKFNHPDCLLSIESKSRAKMRGQASRVHNASRRRKAKVTEGALGTLR
jgi:hypothetical protein